MNTVTVSSELLTQLLKPLKKDSHKGDNGLLNIVAGSEKYRGAADLCVGGALRTGCGIVRLISEECVILAVASRHPTCTFLPIDNARGANEIYSLSGDTFLIGCGLGVSAISAKKVFSSLSVAKKAVIDADALNIIAQNKEQYDVLRGSIITPHVGEFSRLSSLSVDEIKSSPENHALEFSRKYGCVTVLKDAKTVIATQSGELYISENASVGLSKGGSGDVLAGLIAGFLAQGYSDTDAAVIGVTVHALSSLLCEKDMGKRSMLPSDLEFYVAKLMAQLGF